MMRLLSNVHVSGDKARNSSKHNFQHYANSGDQQLSMLDMSASKASLIVFIFSLICFVDSIHGDFVFDDSEAIVNNNDIRWDAPLSAIFTHDFWGTRLTHPSSHKSYRPLTVLSFRFNYLLSGLSPRSYHIVNIFLHCLVSVSALHVFVPLLGGSRQCALLAAVLFATHPIHTEAVAGVVGRADLLCALFVFSALFAYIRAVKEDMLHQHYHQPQEHITNCIGVSGGNSSSSNSSQLRVGSTSRCRSSINNSGYSSNVINDVSGHGVSYLKNDCSSSKCLMACAVCTSVAMLCKEVGITALGLCSAYELLVISCGDHGVRFFCLLSLVKQGRHCTNCNYGVLSRHMFLCAVGSFLLLGRWIIMGSAVPHFMHVDNPASFMDDAFFRIMNYQYTYFLNLVLLLLPMWLCFDWSMGCVPLISSFTDVRLLTVGGLWLVVGLLLRRGLTARGPVASCVLISLALGVVPFLPATNLFFRVGFVIAERVLYLPVAGFCCLVALGIRELVAQHSLSKRVVLSLYCALVLVFVLRSRQRTQDWLNEQQLFKSGLHVCPLNAKVHYNLGKVAGDAADLTEAVQRYREAIRLNPNYDQAMNNLANILKDEGSLTEALELLQKATLLRPDFAAAWMNLGIVEASLGLLIQAHTSYTTALTHRPVYPDCLYNLGNLYLERDMGDEALLAWSNATVLKASLARAWINTLILLDSRQQYNQAVQTAHQALAHLPNEASIHFNLANTLGKLSRYQDSERHFLHATRLDPNNANYWSNLGVLYHRWKKYSDAEVTYKHTLKLNPSLKSAQDNLNMLLKSSSRAGANTR